MTKRSGLGWLNLGLLATAVAIALGACVVKEDDEESGGSGNTGNVGNTTPSGSLGGAGNVGNTGNTAAKGGATTATTAAKGGTTGTTTPVSTGNVPSCQGVPATQGSAEEQAASCNGSSVEAEPLPVDMIILMDRSISNSYAVGSDTATPATGGQLRRWDVLTAAMDALANSPEAQDLGASITFFSITGGANETQNCDEAAYQTPVVPLGFLKNNGQQIVSAMRALSPSGLTPTVPALTGAFRYAMAEKVKDPTREKVLVLISDGFPTQCSQKSPSDVANVIKEAAAASTSIRTFIIGVGSPSDLDAAKFNLQNYATAGKTGKAPYMLNETAGADAVQKQLVEALLNISSSSLACEYEISPPSAEWVIDPNKVMFTYQPNAGALQEIPKVSGPSTCSYSPNGGWYFDNPVTPTKITVCPCSCANFGAGRATVVYGCKPNIEIL